MSVLVTNASSPKSLVITRSLGRKGVEVTTADSERFSPTFFSKYSKHHFLYAHPEKSPNDFVNTIQNYLKKKKIDVLMPVNSTETILISKNKDKFRPYTKVPFEDFHKMMQVHDKNKVMRIVSELGIRAPKTYTIENTADLQKISKTIEYPVVIKLRNATSSVGVSYAYSASEFISKYQQTIQKYVLTSSDYPIVQEYIPGTGYGVSLLYNHGDLRAIFTHKRLREYPITGGPSTLRISVRHPEMEKAAMKLLGYVGWHGLAMVEFKLDERTNKPYFIEVNPRFWGSLPLAIKAGVDFPTLLFQWGMGMSFPRPEPIIGTTVRNILPGDLLYFLAKKGRVSRDFWDIHKTSDDLLSFHDPGPAFGRIISPLLALYDPQLKAVFKKRQ